MATRSPQSDEEGKKQWGPRSRAAAAVWGEWREEDPYVLPQSVLKTSKQAWQLVLRRLVWRQLLDDRAKRA